MGNQNKKPDRVRSVTNFQYFICYLKTICFGKYLNKPLNLGSFQHNIMLRMIYDENIVSQCIVTQQRKISDRKEDNEKMKEKSQSWMPELIFIYN